MICFILEQIKGLFFKNMGSNNDFKFIENTKGQVWCLKEINNTLFCGHNRGTFRYKDNKAKQISDFPGTWDIKEIKNNKNILLQGNYTGLSILKYEKDQWQFGNKLTGFDISSRFFEMPSDYQIIVNHEFKGVFNLDVDSLFNKVLKVENSDPNGNGSSLVNYRNQLMYSTIKEYLSFILIKKNLLRIRFCPVFLTLLMTSLQEGLSPPIKQINYGDLLHITSFAYHPENLTVYPKLLRIAIPNFFRGNQGLASFECVTHLKDEVYLIGASNGYTVLNLDQLVSQEYLVKINAIYKDYLNSCTRTG